MTNHIVLLDEGVSVATIIRPITNEAFCKATWLGHPAEYNQV